MNKLIKLSENHYIVVDDSEIKENQWYCNNKTLFLSDSKFDEGNNPNQRKNNKLVTYSTRSNKGMENVTFISLSEVEEAVNGYSVEKMADDLVKNHPANRTLNEDGWMSTGYVYGFKAAMELVKDKLFTVNDLKKAIAYAWSSDNKTMGEIIQSLLPKTEWSVTFDEQGKLKLK